MVNTVYASEKLMQWKQQQTEERSRTFWQYSELRKGNVSNREVEMEIETLALACTPQLCCA